MAQSKSWLKIGALVVFSSAALCCAVLGIQLLAQDKTAKAGIATLTFNFTNIHLPNPLIKPRSLPGSNLIPALQSEAQSAASVLATATAAAGSKIQSAAGAAETAVEALIPRNCSLGTKQFCVGFSNHTNCNDLPLNVSDIIPEAIISFIGDEAQSLQPLEGIMAKVAPTIIQGSFVFGLGFLAIMATMFVIVIFSLLSVAAFFLRLGICLLAVLCFVPFIIPTAILYHVQSEIQGFGSIVGIEKGYVTGQCMGALVCAGVMMLLTIFMSIFM
ncbi:hypothetical protein BDZ45DRAFT_739032 [Acephala macrosclerotiorum]|nr:hypothetical protein BDZ45DRAFT_739032 [Acephala macrosclerotiorum]